MKKILFLIIVLILSILIGIVNAQEQIPIVKTNSEDGIRISINAGTHFSNMIGQNVKNNDRFYMGTINNGPYHGTLYVGGYQNPLLGYKFGVGVTFDITKNIAFGFDLNFETKGCRIPIKDIITTVYSNHNEYQERFEVSNLYSKIKMFYLVAPIRTEFRYKKFYCMPGIYTGVLLGAINFTDFDLKNQHFGFRYDVSHHYALLDLGVFLNTGFCFPVFENFIKIGVVGEWNVSGTQNRFLDGGRYMYYCNQVLGLELKYEFKIK